MPSRVPTPQSSMRKLFHPASVAVVGASPTNRWTREPLENFVSIGFSGQVGAVNPRYDEILGFPCAPSLKELPFVPEAVIISVNRDRVVRATEDAAELGVKAAVVFAIGFAEIGGEGRERQDRLTEVARQAGMAVVGPNCQGIINFTAPNAMYMSHVSVYEPGVVALMSESGSVTTALTNNNRGVRWSHVVSTGNEAVVDSADLLEYFVDDPNVKVICAFLETIRDPDRFFAHCDRARAASKPVIVLKSGRTEAARVAATAHSGALSPSDRLVDALFRRHGVIRVESMEELLETAIAMQSARRPRGGNLVSVTASGGQIELILDQVARTPALAHPTLAQKTKSDVAAVLPEFLAPSNPLDYWGMDDMPTNYPSMMRALARDEDVDIVLAVGDFTTHPTGREDRSSMQLDTFSAIAPETDRLLVVLDTVDGSVPADRVEEALCDDVLLLSGLHEGFQALEHLVSYSKTVGEPVRADRLPEQVGHILAQMKVGTSGDPAMQLLAAAGINVPTMAVATSSDEAVRIAESIGLPVVIKTADPQMLHKTESGGVALGVADLDSVRATAERMLAASPAGVMVQEQVQGGVELIVGLQSDPELGCFILVGLGGIWTEVFNDVSIRAVGLRQGEAGEMLTELRGHALLTGARGTKPVDLPAVITVIERLDALAQQYGNDLGSLDLNPLIASDSGVVAVDCLVMPRAEVAQ